MVVASQWTCHKNGSSRKFPTMAISFVPCQRNLYHLWARPAKWQSYDNDLLPQLSNQCDWWSSACGGFWTCCGSTGFTGRSSEFSSSVEQHWRAREKRLGGDALVLRCWPWGRQANSRGQRQPPRSIKELDLPRGLKEVPSQPQGPCERHGTHGLCIAVRYPWPMKEWYLCGPTANKNALWQPGRATVSRQQLVEWLAAAG